MVAFPMHDRRQWHDREIAQRNLQCPRRQTKFNRGATKRFQTRAICRRMTELTNTRETDLASKMPANHTETGRAAIHLIDLLNEFELPDAFFLLPKMPFFVGKWRLRAFRFLDRELAIQRDFVVGQSFSGNQFLGKIESSPKKSPSR